MRKTLNRVFSVLMTFLFIIISYPTSSAYANQLPVDPNQLDFNAIKKSVDASSEKQTVIVDEMSYVQKIRSYTEEELYNLGLTKEEVNYIKNYDYNKDLLKFAKKDEKELEKKGYTSEQIAALKDYDGTTDAVEYAQTYSLSSAVLTLSYSPFLVNDGRYFNIQWYCSWSTNPIFAGTDIIAITWLACNSSSTPIGMYYRYTPQVVIQYYKTETNWYETVVQNGNINIGNVSYNINLAKSIGGGQSVWAKEMAGTIQLQTQSGSSNLYTIQFLASYGHSTLTLVPSVNFDTSGVSLGISFDWSMQDLSRLNRNYYWNGNIKY